MLPGLSGRAECPSEAELATWKTLPQAKQRFDEARIMPTARVNVWCSLQAGDRPCLRSGERFNGFRWGIAGVIRPPWRQPERLPMLRGESAITTSLAQRVELAGQRVLLTRKARAPVRVSG